MPQGSARATGRDKERSAPPENPTDPEESWPRPFLAQAHWPSELATNLGGRLRVQGQPCRSQQADAELPQSIFLSSTCISLRIRVQPANRLLHTHATCLKRATWRAMLVKTRTPAPAMRMPMSNTRSASPPEAHAGLRIVDPGPRLGGSCHQRKGTETVQREADVFGFPVRYLRALCLGLVGGKSETLSSTARFAAMPSTRSRLQASCASPRGLSEDQPVDRRLLLQLPTQSQLRSSRPHF